MISLVTVDVPELPPGALDSCEDGQITIVAEALPNRFGGWRPSVTSSGSRRVEMAYSSYGVGRDEALTRAIELAHDEAERYIGDWAIRILVVGRCVEATNAARS